MDIIDKDHSKLEKQIEKLYRANYDSLVVYVSCSVQGSMAVEDIVQDTFCEALAKAEILENHPNQKGWLVETAKNKIKEMHRRAQYRETENIEDCEDEVPVIMREYDMVEAQMVMENALDSHERWLLRQYYIWGYSVKELAATEHLSESNFKVRMYRIKKKVMDYINETDTTHTAQGKRERARKRQKERQKERQCNGNNETGNRAEHRAEDETGKKTRQEAGNESGKARTDSNGEKTSPVVYIGSFEGGV